MIGNVTINLLAKYLLGIAKNEKKVLNKNYIY
jgi:hypothetical protein